MKSMIEKISVNREILLLSLARFFQSLAAAVFIPILPNYIAHLASPLAGHLPLATRAGLLISGFGLFMTLAQHPISTLSDRLGKRKVFVVTAIVVFAILCLAIAFVQNYYSLVLLRCLQGFCVGATIPVLLAMVSAFSSQGNRGRMMGWYGTFHLVGFVVGPLIGGFLTDLYGFAVAFYSGTALAGISLFLLIFFVKEPEKEKDSPPESSSEGKEERKNSTGKLLIDHYLLAVILFGMMVGITLIVPLFPLYREKLGASHSDLSWIFSALVITRLLTQIPVGTLADVFSKRKLMIMGLIAFAPATYLLGVATTIEGMIILRLVQGAAATLIMTPAMALAANLAPEGGQSRAMGTVGMGITSGVCLGPLMAGLVVAIDPLLPFVIATGLCLVAAFMTWKFLREEEESLAQSSAEE